MEIDTVNYPHLAKFQIREYQKAQEKKHDRELVEQFGRIEEQENEEIWNLEKLNKVK